MRSGESYDGAKASGMERVGFFGGLVEKGIPKSK